jgi:squalene-hopene/tetraprenyl-beta-curcumene cyclase
MTLHLDRERLLAAHRTIRSDLLAERLPQGYWVGRLSSSPLATATAISALVLAEQGGTSCGLPAYTPGKKLENSADELYRGDLSELIVHSLHWLAEQQNEDGGWGDTDRSTSNIATTMLVEAAFHLTGVPAKYKNLLERAEQYVESQGGVPALKRHCESDRTLVVPVLMNYALADLLPWRKVPALPFELACLPQVWRRRLKLPMMNYALPALLAIGLARFHQAPPRNPLTRWLRAAARGRSMALIQALQPTSGGFLEATPLTSFVVMSLASAGLIDHPIVRHGVEFLLTSVRADGSWPIETNLATWNTSLALAALNWNFEPESRDVGKQPSAEAEAALDWLLSCQHGESHTWTGTAPGGWAWTNLSGGIPNADDTAAALLALAAWQRRWPNQRTMEVKRAARIGACWLLELENHDGGWPTYRRGGGRSPYDRSSADVTAHVLRALGAWRELLSVETANVPLAWRIGQALDQGVQYLKRQQQPDGSWLSLWFGNQLHPQQANPVYGTAQVLVMCRELELGHTEMAQRGVIWLTKVQLAGGGWGAVGGRAAGKKPRVDALGVWEMAASVEETALAIEALLPFGSADEIVAAALQQGVSWLTDAVLEGRHEEPAPLGFYFAKIWYYERLYPQIFAARALASASRAVHGASAAVGVAR